MAGKVIRPCAFFRSGSGLADRSAAVYGWGGFANMVCVSPTSTIRHIYITAVRSATWCTTCRLCVVTSIARPSLSRKSFDRFNTSPWTDTSRPAVGSSAMINRGSRAIARATPTRRAWPSSTALTEKGPSAVDHPSKKRQRNPGIGKLTPHAEWVREQVAAKGEITLDEMAARLKAERGVSVAASSIWRLFQRLGLSHKKRPSGA